MFHDEFNNNVGLAGTDNRAITGRRHLWPVVLPCTTELTPLVGGGDIATKYIIYYPI